MIGVATVKNKIVLYKLALDTTIKMLSKRFLFKIIYGCIIVVL